MAEKQSKLMYLPWSLTVTMAVLAIVVWGVSVQWHLSGLSLYQVFPVLGLLAFSIMWSHYVWGFLRKQFFNDLQVPHFFAWTSYVVLAAILLHPGLLAYQRFRDGFGLPPGSETSYVAHSMAWVVILGIISLFCFLAFEFHRWFSHKKWWFIVPRINDVAMVAIFYHGLRLGTQTHIGWYRPIWWFYGVTLVGILTYNAFKALRRRATP